MSSSWFMYVYYDFWHQYGCPLVEEYPFMSTPWPVLGLVGLYLYLVKFIGPRIMSTRQPFDLRWPMRMFNTFMIGFNLWGLWNMMLRTNFGLDVWKCPKSCANTDPYIVWLGWILFLSRIAEFLDTIFFVLRKKYRQVSNLHVFHHSIVPIAIWTAFKFVPSVENAIYPYLNTMVHAVMYFYYTLASFGPGMQRYLKWKKYLTAVQLIQFVIIIIHSIRVPFIPGCAVDSVSFISVSIITGGVFFYLFYHFYLENYCQNTINYKACTSSQNNNECVCQDCLKGLDTKATIDTNKYQHLIS